MGRQQDPGKAPRCLRHLVSEDNFTDSVHQAHYKWYSQEHHGLLASVWKGQVVPIEVFSGTWLDQLQRRTITVSSPPRCDHHLTGGDLLVVQDVPGWERLMRTFSPRTLGSTRHGGRQRTGMLGTKSSVRQRSARSSPPRRRRMHTVQYCCHKWSVGLSIGNTDVSWPYRFGYLESNYTRNSLGSSLWLWITITDTKHSVIQIVCLLGARGKCEWW